MPVSIKIVSQVNRWLAEWYDYISMRDYICEKIIL